MRPSAKVRFVREEQLSERVSALVERERTRINAILPDAEVHHVGATSLPGSLTKGEVDLCVRVPSSAFAAADSALETVYERNLESCAFRKLWPLFSGNSGRFGGRLILLLELALRQVFGSERRAVEA